VLSPTNPLHAIFPMVNAFDFCSEWYSGTPAPAVLLAPNPM
jgi:hypothetical protein